MTKPLSGTAQAIKLSKKRIGIRSHAELDKVLGFAVGMTAQVYSGHRHMSDAYLLALHLASGVSISAIKELAGIPKIKGAVV